MADKYPFKRQQQTSNDGVPPSNLNKRSQTQQHNVQGMQPQDLYLPGKYHSISSPNDNHRGIQVPPFLEPPTGTTQPPSHFPTLRSSPDSEVSMHTANPQSALASPLVWSRVCPQCKKTPMGRLPAIGPGGRPIESVCEACRQQNIRNSVTAARALQAIPSDNQGSRGSSTQSNRCRRCHRQNTVNGRDLCPECTAADIAFGPHGQANSSAGALPQGDNHVCIQCNRNITALGRAQCHECISAGNTSNRGRRFQPAPLPLQGSHISDIRSGVCDVCHRKQVPPGQRRCEACIILPNTPTTAHMAFFGGQGICVICERAQALPGKAHCNSCQFEGMHGEMPLQAMDELAPEETMFCAICGLSCPRVSNGLCSRCEGSNNITDPIEELPEQSTAYNKLCGCMNPVRAPGAALCEGCFAVFNRVGKIAWPAERRKLWRGASRRRESLGK
nr:uncharacterized protein CTRU02_09037 [Colletotrichum truncatum]KAF6789245.1 hypothetical protein CTRU02_09037 [Colletotrichum truncatum]